MKNLYILGMKNVDIFKLLESINREQPTWDLAGFIDIKKFFKGRVPFGYHFYAGERGIKKLTQDANNYFFCNKPRNIKAIKFITYHTDNIATLVHPSTDLNFVDLGRGCLIDQGCGFGGFIKVGDFVTFRMGCQINHDTVIEDYVFVGPGANIGSNVVLKKRCFIGQGAIVMGGNVIGEGSVVGAGAVVTKDIPPGTVVVGIPAKSMENDRRWFDD